MAKASIPVEVKLDGCKYGLKNPANGKLLQNPWTVLTADQNLREMEAGSK